MASGNIKLNPYPWHWAPEEKIAYYHHVYGTLVASHRLDEVLGGKPDDFREANGYYEYARLVSSVTESDFKYALPHEYAQVAGQLEDIDARWETAGLLHRLVEGCLQDAGITGYIGDYRAKDAFSIWRKARQQNLDVDEVFDVYGIRLTANDSEQAQTIAAALRTRFQPMEPHAFRHHPGPMHQPERGSLEQVNERRFGSLRMNFVHDGTVFEVQIMTRAMLRQQCDFVLEASGLQVADPLIMPKVGDLEVYDDYKGVSGPKPDVAP